MAQEQSNTPQGGLARVVGAAVVALSALAQEYGSGINFVMPHSLQTYPDVQNLVPWAMFVAGLALIPQVVLFARYSKVMPCAGSIYVWLTRTLGPYAGFAVAFLRFVSICAAIGFLAFAAGTFFGDAAHALGLTTRWFTTPAGHLITGLVIIWLIAALHLSGVKNYGYLIYAASALVFIAAAVVILTGFLTSPTTTVTRLGALADIQLAPQAAHPSLGSFISVVGLFIMAYGGLVGATSLGGEVKDAHRNLPRGVGFGWLAALVLYTLVSFSLFHAVPWWAALPIVKSGHGFLLTAPALIGMLLPRFVAVLLNVLVALIMAKTVAPQMLDASRFLFAWGEDGFLPARFASTNRRHAPATATVTTALLGSLFLLDAVVVGWQIGVALAAISISLVLAMLGLGTLLLAWWPRWRGARSYAPECTQGVWLKLMAIAGLVIGLVLAASVAHEKGLPWYFEPWFQLLVAAAIGIALAAGTHARVRGRGADFTARFLAAPLQ